MDLATPQQEQHARTDANAVGWVLTGLTGLVLVVGVVVIRRASSDWMPVVEQHHAYDQDAQDQGVAEPPVAAAPATREPLVLQPIVKQRASWQEGKTASKPGANEKLR